MKYFTLLEINKMIKNNKIIIIRKNIVYDFTKFINKHPGGKDIIIKKIGIDNQKNYNFHSVAAKKKWNKYKIGYIKNNNCNCNIL